MVPSTSVPFPPGVILDRDAFVWATMPPGQGLSGARIVGTCAGDPLELTLEQVTVERGSWRRDLLTSGQPASFPLDPGFPLVVPGVNEIDQIAWDLIGVATRITTHVRRAGGAGQVLRWSAPTTFDLVLVVPEGGSCT